MHGKQTTVFKNEFKHLI